MSEMMHFDISNLNSDYRFVRVVSNDGVFYDLVRKWRTRDHIFRMQQSYPMAQSVGRAFVPPCIFRDFTALDGPENYVPAVWKDGTQNLLPLSAIDRQYVEKACL